MVIAPKPISVRVKRGDDLRVKAVARDRTSEDALAAYNLYLTAYDEWRHAVNADPLDIETVTTKSIAKNNLLQDYEAISVVDITGWEISCSMGWGGITYVNFPVTILNPSQGSFEIYIQGSLTSSLKTRNYLLELRFVQDNLDVISSQNMILVLDANIPAISNP